jgi:LL-diaminopimelate aminotransferase
MMSEESGIQPAKRMDNFKVHFFAQVAVKILRMQSEGLKVIRLDEGSPDLPPTQEIINELTRSANEPTSHSYQPHKGNQELRQAWASMYQRLYRIELNPEKEILPLIGSKEGVFHFPLAFINPGDVVLIPDPGYITYTRGAIHAEGVPYYLPLKPENGYLPDLDLIPKEILRKARIMWLNYPNNPTSATASLDFFYRVIDFARRNHILVCHDAAYCQITYDHYPSPSILQVEGALTTAVEFNTLSKSHNMAGWRAGVIVGNREAIAAFFPIKTNIDSGHFLPVMQAATVAMTGDQKWIKERNEVYRKRRDILVQALHKNGLMAQVPSASLYIWCPIFPGWTSETFAIELLEKAQVSLTPGTVFGANGEGYVRISLTAPDDQIKEAADRLDKIFNELKGKRPG